MFFKTTALCATLLAAGMLAQPAAAQDLIGSYAAYISENDLYNSNGARLGEPWQVLRQERANFHEFGMGDPEDEWDPFFSDRNNRAAMEQMVMNGYMDPQARANILSGGGMVVVNIYGYGGVGDYLDITAY